MCPAGFREGEIDCTSCRPLASKAQAAGDWKNVALGVASLNNADFGTDKGAARSTRPAGNGFSLNHRRAHVLEVQKTVRRGGGLSMTGLIF